MIRWVSFIFLLLQFDRISRRFVSKWKQKLGLTFVIVVFIVFIFDNVFNIFIVICSHHNIYSFTLHVQTNKTHFWIYKYFFFRKSFQNKKNLRKKLCLMKSKHSSSTLAYQTILLTFARPFPFFFFTESVIMRYTNKCFWKSATSHKSHSLILNAIKINKIKKILALWKSITRA